MSETLDRVWGHRLLVAGMLLLAAVVWAADAPKRDEKTDPHLTFAENAYLDRQAKAILDTAEAVFTKNPPQYPEPESRRLAFLLMDGVLHDKYAARRAPVQEFFKRRIAHALDELEHTQVTEGAVIWKLYNMSFIVRTPSVTIAFDLVNGASANADGFCIQDDTMARLAAQCDVLFLSHVHGDHVDENVALHFLDSGKPVVAPPSVWTANPIGARLTRLERTAHVAQPLSVKGGQAELQVVVYPGHQSKSIENNVTLAISPEGLSFCQMGDQNNDGGFMEDFAWIDEVAKNGEVDVLMPACWTANFERMAAGMRPALVMPGHENEMGHTIDHREPYWGDTNYLSLTYSKKRAQLPIVLSVWGESYRYLRVPK